MTNHSPSSKLTIVATSSRVDISHILVEASPPESMNLPSGETDRDQTPLKPECAFIDLTSAPVEISHNLISPSCHPPDKAYLPSGVKATALIPIMPMPICPLNSFTRLSEGMLQSLKTTSSPPDKAYFPSEEKATVLTRGGRKPRSALTLRSILPVATSHKAISFPSDPVKACLPSGENVMAVAN